ncbi:hypothetical protein AB4Y42_31015 [Paraburkholderia sp. EG286B]|uniref:hypothetical protein n=1 Tax=Paraburkholderia sp. EG286B TaxID=3237011 RepID=UPI0034D326E3
MMLLWFMTPRPELRDGTLPGSSLAQLTTGPVMTDSVPWPYAHAYYFAVDFALSSGGRISHDD